MRLEAPSSIEVANSESIGRGVSQEQAKTYSDRLSKGDYLVMIDGTDDDIHRAESVLAAQGIQDWGVYSTIRN